MKVAINTLVTPLEKAGVGNYLGNLLDQLQELDAENLYYIFTCPETRDLFPLRAKNFREICVPLLQTNRLSSILSTFLWLHTGFLKKCRSLGVHLIHIPNTELILWKKPATVVSILDLAEWHVRKYSLLRTWYRKIGNRLQAKRSRLIITISESTKRDLVKFFRVPEEKIAVTYLAASQMFQAEIEVSSARELLKENYGINAGFVLSVASHDKHKNIDGLLSAVALLKKKRGLDWKLVLVGKEESGRSRIRKFISELSLAEDVILTGYVPDEHLPCFYSCARMFVFPTLWEGFGLPVLEAMSCGCPVVCSNLASLPEVADGAAILIDPYDVVQIADAISRIEENPEWESRLRTEGPLQAGKFSYRQTAELTISAYQKAMKILT